MPHLCPHCGGVLSGSMEDRRRNDIDDMIYEYKHGSTLQEIGDKHGLTRERVRQLIKKNGEQDILGGASLKAIFKMIPKAVAKKQRMEQRKFDVYGCSVDMFQKINFPFKVSDRNSPARKYLTHKKSSNRRGIEFNLTLVQWWEIWQESGHWEERGRGKGYCMTRIGDTGPYEIGNVEIKTIGQNFSDSFLKYTHKHRQEKSLQRIQQIAAHGESQNG